MEKKKKEANRQKVQLWAKKRKKEVEEKARVEVEHATKQQAKQEVDESEWSDKSPSPQMKEEEYSDQGGSGQEE